MIKRRRNKKLEHEVKYNVLMNTEVNAELLETYKASNISTGMEADEEKEHHLRKIITQGCGDIPTPVISIQEDYVRYGEYRRPREFVKWCDDVPNDAILVEDYDIEFMKSHEVGEKELHALLEDPEKSKDASQALQNYASRRLVKIINDESSLDAYICFRRRTHKLSRKSRRSEANINERLRRMWVELNTLKKLYELHLKRCELSREYVECSRDIANIGAALDQDSRLWKKIQKKMFKKRKSTIPAEYYKTCGPFKELFGNYEKVKELKDFLYNQCPKMNSLDLEREAKALDNYKRRKLKSKEDT